MLHRVVALSLLLVHPALVMGQDVVAHGGTKASVTRLTCVIGCGRGHSLLASDVTAPIGTQSTSAQPIAPSFWRADGDTTDITRERGSVSGTVWDSATHRPIASAQVIIRDTPIGTRTGNDGHFVLHGVPSGVQTLAVRILGYRSVTQRVDVVAGETVQRDVTLTASNPELSRVIVTGTVIGTEEKAIPNAITVITAADIEKRGIVRIGQLFRGQVPGLVALNTAASSADEVQMFSRGSVSTSQSFAASEVMKTYVDGVEMADPSYMNTLDMSTVDHIEILTGPQASTIYGSNALNGVIQIFTKRGARKPAEITTTLTFGTLEGSYTPGVTEKYDANVQVVGTQGPGISYLANVTGRYTGPWIPGRPEKYLSGSAGIHQQQPRLSWDMSLYSNLHAIRGLENGVQDATRNNIQYIRDGSWAYNARLFGARLATLSNVTGGVAATVMGTLVPWWVQQVTVGRSTSSWEIAQNSPVYITPRDSLNRMVRRASQVLNGSYNTTVQGSLKSLRGILTAGFDGTDTRYHSVTGSAANLGSITSSYVDMLMFSDLGRARGGFVQTQLSVNDALFFTYGLRGEYSSLYGGRYGISYSPRYGVSYVSAMGPVTAKLRAAYGYGTRPPTRDQVEALVEDAGSDFGVITTQYAAPYLGPESQHGGEGGIDLYVSNVMSLAVTVYNQTVDNLIERFQVDTVYSMLTPTSRTFISQFYNAANIRNRGTEVSANVNHGPWSARGVYSYTRSRILAVLDSAAHLTKLNSGGQLHAGDAVTYLPEHTWHVETGYAAANTSLLLFVDGVSRVPRAVARSGIALVPYVSRYKGGEVSRVYQSLGNLSTVAPAYAMLGIRAQHRVLKTIDITVQVENLANRYQSDDAMQSPVLGRQVSLGVRFRR